MNSNHTDTHLDDDAAADSLLRSLLEDATSIAPDELRDRAHRLTAPVSDPPRRRRRAARPKHIVRAGFAMAGCLAAITIAAVLPGGEDVGGSGSDLPLLPRSASAATVLERAATLSADGSVNDSPSIRITLGAAMGSGGAVPSYEIDDGELVAVVRDAAGAEQRRSASVCKAGTAPNANCVDAIDFELRKALLANEAEARSDLQRWLSNATSVDYGTYPFPELREYCPEKRVHVVNSQTGLSPCDRLDDPVITPLRDAIARMTTIPGGNGALGGSVDQTIFVVRLLQLPEIDPKIRAAAWRMLGDTSTALKRVDGDTTFAGAPTIALEGSSDAAIGSAADTFGPTRRVEMTRSRFDALNTGYSPDMNKLCPAGVGRMLSLSITGPLSVDRPSNGSTGASLVCAAPRTVRFHFDERAHRIVGVEELDADGNAAHGPANTVVDIEFTD